MHALRRLAIVSGRVAAPETSVRNVSEPAFGANTGHCASERIVAGQSRIRADVEMGQLALEQAGDLRAYRMCLVQNDPAVHFAKAVDLCPKRAMIRFEKQFPATR